MSELEREGIPDHDDPLNQDEGIMPPRDHPVAADDYGVTAEEQRQPEPLAERVERERPDVFTADKDDVGRVVEPDRGAATDTEAALVGTETEDDTALSAEESAMHVVDEP